MKQIQRAIEEEKLYIQDRLNNIDTSLISRLSQYGYNSLDEYFTEKREHLFGQWNPEVYYVDVNTLTTDLETAVQNEKYGIYISTTNSLYAFHGSDEIDYELCEKLGVVVAEVFHHGGTIIGGVEDLGIEFVIPQSFGITTKFMLDKFYNIISKYETNVEVSGNDILVNGEKVLGSMTRHVGNAFVWAAQISFCEHRDIIEQICMKRSTKKPGTIKNEKLTKQELLREVFEWLQKP